jgi:hypothetical protein
MNTRLHKPLLIVLVVLTAILVISVLSMRVTSAAEIQMKINLIQSSMGALIGLLAAVLLLLRAAAGASVVDLLPLVLPVLAGALLTGSHWAVALVMGLMVLALFAARILGTPAERAGERRAGDGPAD